MQFSLIVVLTIHPARNIVREQALLVPASDAYSCEGDLTLTGHKIDLSGLPKLTHGV